MRKLPKGYTPRLFGYALATIVVGMTVAAGAVISAASSSLSTGSAIGIGVFFLLAMASELRPVPIDVEGERLVSLAFVFVVASQLLFGVQWSILIGALAIGIAQLPLHVDAVKACFNSAVYAIAAVLASLPAHVLAADIGRSQYGRVVGVVFVSGAIFVFMNVALVCGAIALATGSRYPRVLTDHLRHSGPAFSIMVFIAVQAVIFWSLSPALVALVGAPLFTLNLYMWAAVRSRVALRAAVTDSLTGLKNHRSYQAELAELLQRAAADGSSVSICLIDVDRFKQVNDRHGHPAGDAVLKGFGAGVEQTAPGLGYRIGGDEFALIVPGGAVETSELVTRLQALLAELIAEDVPESITISAGIACFPDHGSEAEELEKRADLALYRSKHGGKNRVSIYDDAALDTMPGQFADVLARDARLRTAEKLIAVVDTRDTYTGEHSVAVSRLAEAIGRNLALDEETLRHLRLAGLLHDLGKVAIPDQILKKRGLLEPHEVQLVRTHPQVGHDLLDGLDVAPVDSWILHHHEHFDGTGYPLGLSGAEIPLGSRIILVADAFEAMTTNRSYRAAISVEAAMDELREKAGAQFDPLVVAALESHLATGGESRIPEAVPAWSS